MLTLGLGISFCSMVTLLTTSTLLLEKAAVVAATVFAALETKKGSEIRLRAIPKTSATLSRTSKEPL